MYALAHPIWEKEQTSYLLSFAAFADSLIKRDCESLDSFGGEGSRRNGVGVVTADLIGVWNHPGNLP